MFVGGCLDAVGAHDATKGLFGKSASAGVTAERESQGGATGPTAVRRYPRAFLARAAILSACANALRD